MAAVVSAWRGLWERWHRWLWAWGEGRPRTTAAIETVVGFWELAKWVLLVGAFLYLCLAFVSFD